MLNTIFMFLRGKDVNYMCAYLLAMYSMCNIMLQSRCIRHMFRSYSATIDFPVNWHEISDDAWVFPLQRNSLWFPLMHNDEHYLCSHVPRLLLPVIHAVLEFPQTFHDLPCLMVGVPLGFPLLGQY